MKPNRQLLTALSFLIAGALWSGKAGAQSGPRERIEEATQQIRQILSKQAPPSSPAAAQQDKQLQTVVNQLLDIDHMAEEALGRQWRRRSETERQQYLALMRQLVERSYLRQARERTEYQVRIVSVDIDDDEAEVETMLEFETRGRQERIEVIYSLELRDDRWRVVDIETDGASTVRNYRAQFRRIIRSQGFEELLNRMRQRIEAGESTL